MLAVLTVGFHASRWTDHEVGFALGRGRLVLPLRVPEDPYGLMGKIQGLRGDLDSPKSLAPRIVDILLARPETSGRMREGLVRPDCRCRATVKTTAENRISASAAASGAVAAARSGNL